MVMSLNSVFFHLSLVTTSFPSPRTCRGDPPRRFQPNSLKPLHIFTTSHHPSATVGRLSPTSYAGQLTGVVWGLKLSGPDLSLQGEDLISINQGWVGLLWPFGHSWVHLSQLVGLALLCSLGWVVCLPKKRWIRELGKVSSPHLV